MACNSLIMDGLSTKVPPPLLLVMACNSLIPRWILREILVGEMGGRGLG